MKDFPQIETHFLLASPAGELEVVATPRKQNVTPFPAVAIICHPHPVFGGTMTNKVVSTLMRAFSDMGLQTVRFNFRGVGKSTGTFAEGVGEIDDLLAVIAWVKSVSPDDAIWLSGFSFGAAMSAHGATKVPVAQLVSIAPPVPRFNLPTLPPVTCPWLIIQGEEDDVVIPQDVYAWIETRDPKPQLIRVPGTGHYFHGKLMELRELLVANLPGIIEK
ncbi:MAG: CocE/NonD family hydrolase [Gammaproteobacteria bacterium]|nr:CocE/NonD family hydrolase [Gammaproteobacteria bacterium]